MRTKVLLLLVVSSCIQLFLSAEVFTMGRLVQATSNSLGGDEIAQTLGAIYSTNSIVRDTAKKKLLVASKSAKARSQITHTLIRALDDPKANSGTRYDAAELLGELKAIEAVETLVKYLDYNDGVVGLSSSHFPALKALVAIGEPSVSKLIKTLFEGQPSTRAKAALALGMIGGDRAKSALERALVTETNEEVAQHVRIALNSK